MHAPEQAAAGIRRRRLRAIALAAMGVALTLALVAGFLLHERLPPELWRDGQTAAAVAIFAATYLVIAVGKLPGFRLDRAGAALLGASLMVGFGILPLDAAYRAIDFDTIALLLGMMIVVSVSQIPYGSFAAALSPIAACGLALTVVLIAVIHRREFFTRERLDPLPHRPPRYHGPLVVKSVLVAAGMMVLFFAGAPVPI